jgi:hypothetical protein
MKPILLIAASLVATAALISCGERQIRGGGDEGTVSRNLPAFGAVEVHGAEDVEFLPASAPRVEVQGYRNLLTHYKTVVKGGTLHLGYDDDDDLDVNIRNSNLRVRVYSPGFESIGLAGSGDVVIRDGATTPVQRVELAGSGDITLRQPEVPRLAMTIAGSGNIMAKGAPAATVRAEIAGSGNIETTVSTRLEAEIAGSGDIQYWGNPQVSKDIAGSGDVVRR